MENVLVGCGQLTWYNHSAMENPSEEQVLDEIARAGYDGAPASSRGGRSGEETIGVYARYGLKPAPGYFGADFWRKDQHEEILEQARAKVQFTVDVGCDALYVAPGGFDSYVSRGMTRRDLAARVTPEDSLSESEYQQFADTLNEVGEIALEAGVKACFHNHVGAVIETREEIDELFSRVDSNLVFQGPDIGHLAWAGANVLEFCRDYADAIETVHLKDIDPTVLAEGRKKEWGYRDYSKHGIFAELGEGMINFPAMFEVLEDAGFEGWLIVETDVTMKPTPFASAVLSREYLKRLGI